MDKIETTLQSNRSTCEHWGLTNWFCGIKEYVVDRCLCYGKYEFDPIDRNRIYFNEEKNISTNCFCVFPAGDYVNDCFNNPIGGTLCFPVSAITHLICLPIACCSPNQDTGYNVRNMKKKEETIGTHCDYNFSYYSTPTSYGYKNYWQDPEFQRRQMEVVAWNINPINPYGLNPLHPGWKC
uniref:Uncharacterized protein n=1 Tax=viral metagenome TaxID=1070528 RepID=A0A6C0CAC5_9ZZZZ